MEREAVVSSQLKSIGYDPSTQKMHIEFGRQSVYEYSNITPEFYAAFRAAPSLGSFFLKQIKTKPDLYPYQRIDKQVEPAPTFPMLVDRNGNPLPLGARVKYAPQYAMDLNDNPFVQYGTVKSWNAEHVFVTYDSTPVASATHPKDLEVIPDVAVEPAS
jgi:hypothetical protein